MQQAFWMCGAKPMQSLIVGTSGNVRRSRSGNVRCSVERTQIVSERQTPPEKQMHVCSRSECCKIWRYVTQIC